MKAEPTLMLRIGIADCTDNRAVICIAAETVGHQKTSTMSRTVEIHGKIRGPFNRFAATLPTTYPLSTLGPETGYLGQSVIPDPCVWSPELPHLYQIEVSGKLADGRTLTASGRFPIRRFQCIGQDLFFNGKRWVMRGIYDYGPVADVDTWREFATVRITRKPFSSHLAQADESGLIVVRQYPAQWSPSGSSRRKEQIPVHATRIEVAPSNVKVRKEYRHQVIPELLAQQVSRKSELQPWAHIAWMNVTDPTEFAKGIQGIDIPIIAVRRYHGTSLAEARAAIDTLQADLAPIGQFAGYVV